MVDIIRPHHTIVNVNDVLDELHDVALGNRAMGAWNHALTFQPLIELVATNALQVIATLVEQLLRHEFTRIVERGRVARANALEELDQRFLRNWARWACKPIPAPA